MSVLSRSAVMWLAPVFLLLACDPPPTAIPPGQPQTVAPPQPERPAPPPSTPVTPPTPIEQPTDAGAAPTPEPGGQPAAAQGAVGAACDSAADCQTGICEGSGCGPKQGRCAAKNRSCTRDRRPYCGCDGNTFHASGSCPGARFSSRGMCTGGGGGTTDNPVPAADGAACAAGADCKSGICEGQGCGDAKGVCVSKKRACTADLRAYCGCDGVTFRGSSSCPGRRYAARGECKK